MKTNGIKWRALMLSALCVGVLGACGPESAELADESGELLASTEPITSVEHSRVEQQSIGNCWLYATAGWLESLNKSATGEELNTSESYTTYWHWFDQIANGTQRTSISTGGSYNTAIEIYTRYGVMLQKDFIPEEATRDMSARQASALDAINASLSKGALSTREARRNRALVRAELDRAWGLRPEVIQLLNTVFGETVSRTLDRAYVTSKPSTVLGASGTEISVLRTLDIPVQVKNPKTAGFAQVTLSDVIGKKTSYSRSGTWAWKQANYPYSARSRRDLQRRIQRALHDGQPVIMSWFVDFNALARDGSFTVEELERRGGPGSQGGHMVLMHDYEAVNVPGFGTLSAGVDETRPEALEAALDPSAEIKFIRIKNSWGTYRPDRWADAPLPGYHDLHMTYLDGPVQQCATKADGSTDTSRCSSTQPFWDVVLPAGY